MTPLSMSMKRALGLLALGSIVLLTAIPARADLALELASPKPEYLVDEPLFLTVAVRNPGPGDAEILRLLDPAHGILTFEVTAPGEAAHRLDYWVSATMFREGLEKCVVNLGPGERYSAAVDITYEIRQGRRPTLLSAPGQYVIRASYCVPEDWPTGPLSLSSEELHLVVTELAGADARAHAILQQGARTRDHGPWNANTQQAECYEKLLRECPDSGYAIHAAFYLAQVRELEADMKLRGTPQAAMAMRTAAEVFASVAHEAGDTPLGVYAKRLAGRVFAKMGDVLHAQAFLEAGFAAPSATDGDRLEAMSWMSHVESGLFYRDGGLAPPGFTTTGQLRLPLRRFAQALGLAVRWDGASKTVTISGRRVRGTLTPGERRVVVNDAERSGVMTRLKDGRTEVSLSVIAALMAEQRGPGIANALSALLARAPSTARQ